MHKNGFGIKAILLVQIAVSPRPDPTDRLLPPLLDHPHHRRRQLPGFLGSEKLFDLQIPLLVVFCDLFLVPHAFAP